MKYKEFNPQELEKEILSFWKHHKITQKLRDKNSVNQKFYFLDGPPYTSGRIHLGHAWNKTLKDIVLRYKRMQGFNVWDRAGFDMHGLPTEHKVMAKHNLKNKHDIEKFGLEQFRKECYDFCVEMMNAMIKDFERIGATLDFSDPDQPIKAQRISKVWGFIKKVHEDGRLYLGKRALHWDPKDQSALAKHELEYKDITDDSIYLKFKLQEKENEYLLIWTTTPWTIPLNLVAVVHPEFDYVRCQVENEVWIVAEKLADTVIKEIAGKEYSVIETIKGKELEGTKYLPSFPDGFEEIKEARKENDLIYTVLLSQDAVHLDEGTGLVHFAPGCGESDYELCVRKGIEPFNPIDESGVYPQGSIFAGFIAKTDDTKFIELMKENGSLVAQKKIRHSYPHGERSKAAVIFRTTPQWFLKVSDLKEEMIANNEAVHWVPVAGKNAFRSWLQNLRDNSITKQRFWGTPAPIWRAEDGDIHVIGSIEELKELAKTPVPQDLHKPGIDDVIIEKDGKEYTRIPDVLDVWIDPGTQSWIMLQDEENFDNFYPADFIVEGKDQIRAWFNLLWICSHLYLRKPAFKNVFMHGFVTDVNGVKMSKSLGNIISPYEIIDKHGADVMRYYMSQTTAGEDINFSWDELKVKHRHLQIVWNTHKFLLTLCKDSGINPTTLDQNLTQDMFGVEEKYMFSILNSTIEKVTSLMDSYELANIIEPIEELFLELSRTYIQMVREKAASETKENLEVVIHTVYSVLLETCKMLQIVCPFISEAIYQNFKVAFHLEEESIAHFSWPEVEKNKQSAALETQMTIAKDVIGAALYAREKAKRGVRWPLKELVVVSTDTTAVEAVETLRDIIKTQLNIKSISILQSLPGVTTSVKPDAGKIGPKYGKLSPAIIKHLQEASTPEIITAFEAQGQYSFTLEEQEINITPEMVHVEREVPALYKDAPFSQGVVYVNTENSEELEAEGFAREIMRHVQQSRKKAGMQKQDDIILFIQTSEDLLDFLVRHETNIKEKVGAITLEISTQNPARKHQHEAQAKIKDQTAKIFFDKA